MTAVRYLGVACSWSSLEQARVSQRGIRHGATPGDPDSPETRTGGSELITVRGSKCLQEHFINAPPLNSDQHVPLNTQIRNKVPT